MAQHILCSSEGRNFAREVRNLTPDSAEFLCAQVRWGSATEQACPRCGVFRKHYRRKKRKTWRCADCAHEFSVTSGSLLDGHKLPLTEIISWILASDAGVKGQSLLEVSRHIGCTPKTAQVMIGKTREAHIRAVDLTPMKGIVHMDGGYFGGKPRKTNRRRRVSREAIAVRFGKKLPRDVSRPWVDAGMTHRNWQKRLNKRAVISVCEAGEMGTGSKRVLAFVCGRSEGAEDIARLATHLVHPRAMVMTDESPAYNVLDATHEHYFVSHRDEYSSAEGVSDNMCETFFSRMRRAEYGIFHGYRPKYLQDYVTESAWRESNRQLSQRDRVLEILKRLLTASRSRWWRGYWQGHHRDHELTLDDFLPSDK